MKWRSARTETWCAIPLLAILGSCVCVHHRAIQLAADARCGANRRRLEWLGITERLGSGAVHVKPAQQTATTRVVPEGTR
jgi:hypothetical protein